VGGARRGQFEGMSLHIMGDTGYLVQLDGELDAALLGRVRGLAAALHADLLAGVVEIVPAFGSLGVIYEPERVPTPRGELPWRVVGEWLERHLNANPSAAKARKPREHVVPVCYGGEHGPDLEAVAKAAKLDTDAAVKLHAGATYEVAALGFAPGFPYLTGLPERLAMPRRATPRSQVPAGSVGIGGKQTGIYPSATPGGWQVVGRTALTLFDPLAAEPVLLSAGDRVRFKPVVTLPAAVPAARGTGKALLDTIAQGAGAGWFEVVKPGTLTTVQAGARRGLAQFGITGGGAMDPWAMAAANLALGNAPDASLLECTYVGPVLRFEAGATVALLGAEVAGLPAGRPLVLAAGDELDLSKFTKGARLYLAVAGGLRVAGVLGGAATAVGARFGGHEGRALAAGDRLAYGGAEARGCAPGKSWRVAPPVAVPGRKDVIEVRLVPGPDWASFFKPGRTDAAEKLAARVFRLSAKSDRMGLRLSGEALEALAGVGAERWSRAVVPGTVQVPPDGQPIVLMAEGQTIGGYLQLGQVASIDLPKLVQARPGADIVFRVVDITEAQSARLRVAADLTRLQVGLGMLR
jgi:KipI family sensor histidine kinase inhibitor